MTPEKLIKHISANHGDMIEASLVDKDHAVVNTTPTIVHDLIERIKDDPELKFDFFMDLTAVDWLPKDREPRFDMVYHLYSTDYNHRLRIKVALDDDADVPTMSDLYPIADWMEREVWDLYGLKFNGHPNLKRIMMYDEFEGHPLRKDFDYDNRQPRTEETWPVRDKQVQVDNLGIHRP